MIKPCAIDKFSIYDISKKDESTIVTALPYQKLNISINSKSGELIHCPHNHCKIYKFDCDESSINIEVNNHSYSVNPTPYPSFKDKIVFSAMVKNEDSYIRQWIDYHHSIGVDNFVIYDNGNTKPDGSSYCSQEESSNLQSLLSDYIFSGIVCLIKWRYPKRINGLISGQVCQQNHSIYNFSDAKYIGFLDIDEYLNPQKHINIKDMIIDLEKSGYDYSKYSGIKIKNKFFHNPHNLPTDGLNFLNIYNCNELTREGREKNIINPQNARTIAIHEVTSGKKCFNVSPKLCYFNHYYFLNKTYRGNESCNSIDKSISKHIIIK